MGVWSMKVVKKYIKRMSFVTCLSSSEMDAMSLSKTNWKSRAVKEKNGGSGQYLWG